MDSPLPSSPSSPSSLSSSSFSSLYWSGNSQDCHHFWRLQQINLFGKKTKYYMADMQKYQDNRHGIMAWPAQNDNRISRDFDSNFEFSACCHSQQRHALIREGSEEGGRKGVKKGKRSRNWSKLRPKSCSASKNWLYDPYLPYIWTIPLILDMCRLSPPPSSCVLGLGFSWPLPCYTYCQR